MKKLLLTLLACTSTLSFAQDGFIIQDPTEASPALPSSNTKVAYFDLKIYQVNTDYNRATWQNTLNLPITSSSVGATTYSSKDVTSAVNTLEQQGVLSDITMTAISTFENESRIVAFTEEQTYLKEVQMVYGSDHKVIGENQVPGTLTTGLKVSVKPTNMTDNSLTYDFAFEQIVLNKMESFTSGTSHIDLPNSSNYFFNIKNITSDYNQSFITGVPYKTGNWELVILTPYKQ